MSTKKQKGFIQIPLLLIIIASTVIVSAGAGYVLHKQGKLKPVVSKISSLVNGNNATVNDGENIVKNFEPTQNLNNQATSSDSEIDKLKKEIEILKIQNQSTKIIERQIIKEVSKESTQKNQEAPSVSPIPSPTPEAKQAPLDTQQKITENTKAQDNKEVEYNSCRDFIIEYKKNVSEISIGSQYYLDAEKKTVSEDYSFAKTYADNAIIHYDNAYQINLNNKESLCPSFYALVSDVKKLNSNYIVYSKQLSQTLKQICIYYEERRFDNAINLTYEMTSLKNSMKTTLAELEQKLIELKNVTNQYFGKSIF